MSGNGLRTANLISNVGNCLYFPVTLFKVGFLFVADLVVANLDLQSRFIVRFQLGPSI